MNEYVRQAKEFLKKCNATLKIIKIGCEQDKHLNDGNLHNTYRATIKTPRGSMWVKFWDSVYNTQHGNKPTEFDVLACLNEYDAGDIFTAEQIKALQEIK